MSINRRHALGWTLPSRAACEYFLSTSNSRLRVLRATGSCKALRASSQPVDSLRNPALPHTHTAEQLAASTGTRIEVGLSADAVSRRQRQFGQTVPPLRRRDRFGEFAGQFASALILILLGASVLSAAIGNTKDAIVIACVVVINALFGFYQEFRAERSLAALKDMLPVRARVRRAGVVQEVLAEDLVPGDVALVEAGDRIAADGRIVLAANLEIDESTLTGESVPVAKITEALPDANLAIGDRANMTYMNTLADPRPG